MPILPHDIPLSESDMVEVRELTTYEVAPDGSSIRMSFLDTEGRKMSIVVPMHNLQQLAFTIPKMVGDAMQAAYATPALRLVHKVDMWQAERGDDGRSVILTFATPDHFQMSFAVDGKDLASMAESAADHEMQTHPEGLQFH